MTRFTLRPAPLALSIVLAFAAATTAHAQQPDAVGWPQGAREIRIAAQPLAQALNDWARQTDIPIVVQQVLVSGRMAPAVSGQLSARQALDRLLSGSGLAATLQDGAAVVSATAEPGAAAAPGAGSQALPTVRVRAQAGRLATTEGTASYTTSAVTLGKSEHSLRETPQSVSVVTTQQMRDRGATGLHEALALSPGVNVQQSGTAAISGYFSRGFEMSVQSDGSPTGYATGERMLTDMAFYDRIEVLRGAAGLFSGTGTPGGAINLVRKRPTAERQFQVMARAGSWDAYRAEVDLSGPLNADASLRARGVAAYDSRHQFIDIAKDRHRLFYGIVEYDLTPRTLLTAGGHLHDRDGVPSALAGHPRLADGSDPRLPRSSFFGTSWNRWDITRDEWFASVEHRFDDDWRLKASAVGQSRNLNYKYASYRTSSLNPATLVVSEMLGYHSGDMDIDERAFELALTGRFQWLGRRHELLLGANSQKIEETRPWTSFNFPITPTSLWDFDPRAIPEPDLSAVSPATSASVQSQTGVYGTLRLNPTDELHLVLGARASRFRTRTERFDTGVVTNRRSEDDVVTPFAGIVYDLGPVWSVYGSYADIFRVQNSYYTVDGRPLDPVVGANWELGLKGELMDGQLNASVALFRINETGRAQEDPDNPSPCAGNPSGGACYTDSGKVRSQGLEAELSGQVRPGWQMTAGYTYNTTKYLRDRTAAGAPSANEGRRYHTYTPTHMLRLWTQHQPAAWGGRLSLGGGVDVQSETYNVASGVRIAQPGRAVWHARLGWRVDEHWDLALNVDNLLDKRYYRRLGSLTNGSDYGPPRAVAVTLRGKF